MAAALFSLRDIAAHTEVPYRTVAYWAAREGWQVARPANRRLGQPALYRDDEIQRRLLRHMDRAA
jgi:hypothetical protein